jgi:hypothetical protein
MFLDKNTVVALEYIFYQIDGNYVRIKKEKEDSKEDHPLGTFEYYNQGLESYPHSIFREKPINLVPNRDRKGDSVDYF